MTFHYNGRDFELFDDPYNSTITNERAVEIPIARAFIAEQEGYGLELGNVLVHYGCTAPRRVVDRYETGFGADNADVFAIDGAYDWIVSVSTIEHVRAGEPSAGDNSWGACAAMLYLRGLLREGGRMLITVGLGQNPTLDRFLAATGNGTTYRRWRHADPRESVWERALTPVFLLPYGPTHGANAVWIGEWQA